MEHENNKPVLVIVEGAQGTGKSSATSYLREHMLNTNLMRLSGMKDKSESASVKSYIYHTNVLDMIKRNSISEMNWVLDRSFISDYVYANIGYKEYKFDAEYQLLCERLSLLAELYDVYVITLLATSSTLESRLCRTKAEYETFSVDSSLKQQIAYLSAIDELPKNIKACLIHTDSLTPDEVGKSIISFIYETTE